MTEGVSYDALDANASQAVEYCELAAKQAPSVLRFQYQLARALQRIDKDRAFALLEQLAKRRYPVAFDNDLRRTCCKLMTAPRCAPGHSIKGIQAAYDDRAEYQPMIDAAIQCVADEVSKIVNPAAAEQRGGA